MHPNERVGIFVDAQNIYHSAKNLHNSRVNFSELKKTLVGEGSPIRAFSYVVRSEEELHEKTGEESFFDALRKAGFELRLKDIQVYPGGFKKADWDVGLAIDAVRFAPSLDVVILVTGDGDFIPLVEYLKWGLGKRVHVAGFSRTTSAKLKEVADVFTELDTIPKLLLGIRKKQHQNQGRNFRKNK